jgi:hypothetical protein
MKDPVALQKMAVIVRQTLNNRCNYLMKACFTGQAEDIRVSLTLLQMLVDNSMGVNSLKLMCISI